MKKHESGSAHVVIIAVLVIGLIGALGILFWQNIINKPSDATTTDGIGKATSSPAPSPSTKAYCTDIEKLCLNYPLDWKVTAQKVDNQTDGLAERIVVSNKAGEAWLRLETGMGGLGGTCDSSDGSYSKILKTYTTKVAGTYLVSEATKAYFVDTAYAVGWVMYNGTTKRWTMDMELNNSKAAETIGKVDSCALGLGVLNGKNAKAEGSDTAGSVAFKYYTGKDDTTYASEAEATKALGSADALAAYTILQSAHYE